MWVFIFVVTLAQENYLPKVFMHLLANANMFVHSSIKSELPAVLQHSETLCYVIIAYIQNIK